MKIEFLRDGSPDCPILRLYSFSDVELKWLYDVVSDLATGQRDRIALHEAPHIEPVGGCRLTFFVRDRDEYLNFVDRPASFQCGLTAASWLNVAGLLEPFLNGRQGYQWLVAGSGDVRLLISTTGDW